MFYANRVLFVHPVRCGGTWLTEWAIRHLYASADFHYLKHATRRELLAVLPQLEPLAAFTIVRDEEERFQSYLAHCRAFDLAKPALDWTTQWEEIARDSHSLSAAEFRRKHFRPIRDYLEPGVRAFSYSDLREVVRWLHQ